MIKSKEKEIHNMIHNMFKPRNATTNSQIDVSTNASQSQFQEGGNFSGSETLAPLLTISTEPNRNRARLAWAHPPVDFLVGPLMLDAALLGDTKRLKSTLGYVQNIDFLDDTGAIALHKAASGGYNDIVQLLLTKGVSIEATDNDNDTPLHIAAWKGHTSTVELLLSKGASIEATNDYKHTPLHFAVSNGHTSTVELLLSKGASIEATNNINDTPLHLAAQYGHTSAVELLLSKGASIKAMNINNYTPLYLARLYDNHEVVRLIARAKVTNS